MVVDKRMIEIIRRARGCQYLWSSQFLVPSHYRHFSRRTDPEVKLRNILSVDVGQRSEMLNPLEGLSEEIKDYRKAMTLVEFSQIISKLSSIIEHDISSKKVARQLAFQMSEYGIELNSSQELGLAFRSLSSLPVKNQEIHHLHSQLRQFIPGPSIHTSLSTALIFPLPIASLIDIYSSVTNLTSHLEPFQLLLETLHPHLTAQCSSLTISHCCEIFYCFQSSLNYSNVLADTMRVISQRLTELHSVPFHSAMSPAMRLLSPPQLTSDRRMSIHQIAHCMFGIKNMPNHAPEIRPIFHILSSQLALNRSEPITLQEIHHNFCCLHGSQINIYHQEVKSLIDTLCELIEYNYTEMSDSPSVPSSSSRDLTVFSSGSYLTEIFSSFANQNSDNHLTQHLLLSLNTILLRTDPPNSKKPLPRYYLSPEQIGFCLVGMRHLSCDHDGVSEVMKSLSLYLKRSMNHPLHEKEIYPVHSHLTGHAITNCLLGMGSMSDENPAVKQMLQAIYEKLRYFTDIHFTPAEICQSLHGFRGMTSKYVKVTQILEILIKRLEEMAPPHPHPNGHSPTFTGKDISMALCGIQRMVPSDSLPSLLKLIDLLLSHGLPLLSEMSLTTLRVVLTSVVHMVWYHLPLPVTFTETLLNSLLNDLHRPSRPPKEQLFELNKIMLFQSLHLLHSQLSHSSSPSSSLPPSLLSKLNQLIATLAPMIPRKETPSIKSKYENKIFTRIQGLFGSYSNVQFVRHDIINGFSTDILLKIKSENKKPRSSSSFPSSLETVSEDDHIVYNIEIDGPSHELAKKQFFYQRRDEYFQQALGIQVIRLSLKDCGSLSGANLDYFLRRALMEKIQLDKLIHKN
jgi:hypothetical protein